MPARTALTTLMASTRSPEEVLADFAADMDALAAMVPPGIGQSIRGAVATLRTDLESVT
jgi:hypothetical protein